MAEEEKENLEHEALPENTREAKKVLEEKIINVVKTIFDPEIPVDIFELGLIYEIKIDDKLNVEVEMTLTSPNCPVAESMPLDVENKVGSVFGVKSAKVNIVFDPPWEKDMMSEEAMLELGFL
ncbi:MAG: iron-sulfur cluster assembly protein [Flavobacteriales bacterium]|nr:iron-sulfur cluster assembly protein [Flavobacteriales bacterium]|tara:strand:- start:612 stop:980 length:369 start_codon:yes stop_codon:yes gene_type:complete